MLQKVHFFLLFLLKTSESYSLLCEHRFRRGSQPIQKPFGRRDGVVANDRRPCILTMKLSNLNSREGSYEGKVAQILDVEPPTLRFPIPQSVSICLRTFKFNRLFLRHMIFSQNCYRSNVIVAS